MPNRVLLVTGNTVIAVDAAYHTGTHMQREFSQYEELDEEKFELVSLGEEGGERFP